MAYFHLLLSFIFLYCISSATPTFAPKHAIQIRTIPGITTGDVLARVGEGFGAAKLLECGNRTAK
jgi:hypothetical protein